MATHSSVLDWRIPGMGDPGGLPSMGSHRFGHDCASQQEEPPQCSSSSSLYLLISISKFIPPHLFPFGNHKLIFDVCESISIL